MVDYRAIERETNVDHVGMLRDDNYRVWQLTVRLHSGQWVTARQDDPWTTESALAWIRPLTWGHDRQPVPGC